LRDESALSTPLSKHANNGDTVKGVEEFDNENQNTPLTEIFSPDYFKTFKTPSPRSPLFQNEGGDVIQEEDDDEDEVIEEQTLRVAEEASVLSPSERVTANSHSSLLLCSALSTIAVSMGISKFKGHDLKTSVTPIAACVALFTILVKKMTCHLLQPTQKHFEEGSPKVVECVRTARDLLIKKISRETVALQAKLKLEDNGARIINMSQGVPCLRIFDASHQAMINFLNTKLLPYCDVIGEAHVRKSAALFVNQFYKQTGENELDESNVVITAGAIQAIYNCMALSIEVTPNK
jgi:hypothetical protein